MASKTSRAQRNAVGVVRVSRVNGRDEQRDRYHTTDNQTDDVAGLARKYGLRLRDTLTDENESGGTMDRPGLNEAIEMVIRGEADTIIVAKLDRFARTVQGALDTLALIEEHGGSLICGDLDIDTSTAAGRLILTQLAAVGEFERGRRREDFARATFNATTAGVFVGVPPTGYLRDVTTRGLVRDPARADLVSGVFERRANGLSWAAIREWWHGETGEWKKSGFFSVMVKNRVYLGELTYAGVTSSVPHPALVAPAVWQAVQATLTAAVRKPRNTDTAALLTGSIRCASCGRRMTVSSAGRGVVIYRCQKGNLSGQSCPRPVAITASRVDDYVAGEFLAWAGGAEMVTTDDAEDDFRAADLAVEAAEQALADYMQAFASVVGVERAQANAGQLMDAIADATRERDALYARRKLAGIRYRVADEWADYTPMQRRDVLAAALDSVVVHPTSVTPSGGRARTAVADRVSIDWRAD
jgi:site-specific DNA recombinase